MLTVASGMKRPHPSNRTEQTMRLAFAIATLTAGITLMTNATFAAPVDPSTDPRIGRERRPDVSPGRIFA